jgi:uncharacterized membrane protein YagU involved in acid resistance
MQIKWFQYRIVHIILATNMFLYKIEIVVVFVIFYRNVSEIWNRIHNWMKELSGLDIVMNKLSIILRKHYIKTIKFSI